MEGDGKVSALVCDAVEAINEQSKDAILASLTANQPVLKEQGWSFLSKLSEAVQDLQLTTEQIHVYENILNALTNIGNAKELTFAFLESCEVFKDSMLFHSSVQYLTKTILKLPVHQRSLDTLSDSLYGHVRVAKFSTNKHTLEEDDDTPDKLYTKNEEENSETLIIVQTLTDHFVTPLADRKHLTTETAKKQVTEVILKLLNYPLLFVLFDKEDDTDLGCTEKLVNALVSISPTISSVIFDSTSLIPNTLFTIEEIAEDPVTLARHCGDNDIVLSAVGNLAYLIFQEGLVRDSMPSVYTGTYKFVTLLPALCNMYRLAAHDVVAYKAIRLLRCLVLMIEDNSLNHDFLDSSSVRETVRFMFWCMQFNEMLTVRQTAARLLPLLISKLNYKARFHLFNWILETEKSPEILSYVYTLIKDLVHVCWSQPSNSYVEEYNDHCLKLMSNIFSPPDGEEGNIIADLNKISSALNLARYLVARDKRRTAVFTSEMKRYIEEYINPVHHCLTSELENLKQRLEQIDSGEYQPIDASVNIGGEVLDNNIVVEREATEGIIAKINLVLYVHSCLTEALN